MINCMKPFKDIKCAVCNGVVYDRAHFTAVEGTLTVYIGSGKCVIALVRSMKELGLSLKEATEMPIAKKEKGA